MGKDQMVIQLVAWGRRARPACYSNRPVSMHPKRVSMKLASGNRLTWGPRGLRLLPQAHALQDEGQVLRWHVSQIGRVIDCDA